MVAGANLVTVTPDDSIYTAARLMLKKGISGLPVIKAGPHETRRLVGIVTEADFLRRRETNTLRRRPRWLELLAGPGKPAEEYVRAASRKIGDIMTTPVVTVNEDTPLEETVQLMEQRNVKRLPVVRDETLVGIITRANVLRAFVRESGKALAMPATDAAIRSNLVAELNRQPWGRLININVRDGSVMLDGPITDERERKAIVLAASNVPGVRKVDDRMVLVEPVVEI
jgi:CBS domain-containing protein